MKNTSTVNIADSADVTNQSKLVIVSNREPYTINVQGKEIKFEKTPGGLVSALDPILKTRNGLWICWEGATKKVSEFEDVTALAEEIDWSTVDIPYDMQSVSLTEKEINHYYYGYANTRIWPLFHYFISRCNFFDEQDWPSYMSANQKFANAIIDHTTDEDWIWIQDYHLLLVPGMVRKQEENRKIGFFLHIPFPSVEIFKIMPRREVILTGMLGSDLIGFHIPSYVEHFMDAIEQLVVDPDIVVYRDENKIVYKGRTIQVLAFPISIDFEQIETLADSPKIKAKAKQLRKEYAVDYIGISVDRLDYTKGILENLEAVRLFFEKYPEYIKRISFIHIAAPTRTEVQAYKQMREEIDQAVGRINGALSVDNWVPIHYYYRSFPLDDVMPFFMIADMAIVSPLRDGMNLVAKEYCASKNNLDGVLILSEFAGAASELNEALLINPFYIEDIADSIYMAIHIPAEVREAIMYSMREKIRKHDIHYWVESFLNEFENAVQNR